MPDQDRRDRPPRAEELFEHYLERRGRDGIDFESFCREHAEVADALRALHSIHLDAGRDRPGRGPSTAEPARSDPDGRFGPAETVPVHPAFRGLANDGARMTSSHRPGPGDAFGPYRVVSVLGEGGFGVVYRAEQERPVRRTVALKLIKPGMDSRELVARFEQERQALALMSHPFIARIYDAGTTGEGRPFFAMEYIDGMPITRFCEDNAMELRERVELFIQTCEAIQHAHQKAVIHRDIKPSNVMVVSEEGGPVPKVIDFGIAKALDQRLTDLTLYTGLGQLIGTPAYMSPEQAEPTGEDIDTRTDIYSLGVLLYEILTGLPPFDFDSFDQGGFAAIQRVIRDEEPPRPSSRLIRWVAERSRSPTAEAAEDGGTADPHAPAESPRPSPEKLRGLARAIRGDLDWITMKAMAKDRARRYASASEFAADLRRHLAHDPVLAGPPGIVYRLGKWTRKHRAVVALLLGSTLLLAGVAGILRYVEESRLEDALRSVRRALSEGDVRAARNSLAILQEGASTRANVVDLSRAVDALENEQLSVRSRELCERAQQHWARYRESRELTARREDSWSAKVLELRTWQPPWERSEEYALHDDLQRSVATSRDHYSRTIIDFQRALEIAPRGSAAEDEVRRAYAEVFRVLSETSLEDGPLTLGAEFFARRGLALDEAVFEDPAARVTVTSQPPGAGVYCFRHVQLEGERWLRPLAFDPARESRAPGTGVVGDPFLRVDLVLTSSLSPFLRGDEVLEVEGRAVRRESELAAALARLEVDEPIRVMVRRGGAQVEEAWVPFPASRYEDGGEHGLPPPFEPGRVLNWREQFGFTLEAFPLVLREDWKAGSTRAGTGVEFRLPAGSYLLVLRRAGHVETRIPLTISGRKASVRVELPQTKDVPPGFIYVSAGPAVCGGDQESFQPLRQGRVHVDAYMISRTEVTFGEYLRFLNEPLRPLDQDGHAEPALERVRRYLEVLRRNGVVRSGRLPLLPVDERDGSRLVVPDRGSGRWRRSPKIASDSWPVHGISHFAALEYAHWLSERVDIGGGWHYRLPNDLEWEKAARGTDRRAFVWGDYPVWSFAWCYRGIPYRSKRLAPVGSTPTDESIYGIRDLTGSVSEHTLGQPSKPYRYTSIRGGNWFNTDAYYGRIATRNGLNPERSALSSGIRLVAEPRGDK